MASRYAAKPGTKKKVERPVGLNRVVTFTESGAICAMPERPRLSLRTMASIFDSIWRARFPSLPSTSSCTGLVRSASNSRS